MSNLTTHVLDTSQGKPAEGMKVQLFKIEEKKSVQLAEVITNKDGRVDQKLLKSENNIGIYELRFFAGDYFNKENLQLTKIKFLDEITISEITATEKPTIASFYGNASPILGDSNAPLTLVEFGDYQCTFCKKFFHETEESIVMNYVKTGKVKMLFKDFIVVDEDSVNAANAAHCANDQKMFWQYHSTLYNNWDGEGTGWASSEQLHQFAVTLGLDMNKFSECISQSKWLSLIHI